MKEEKCQIEDYDSNTECDKEATHTLTFIPAWNRGSAESAGVTAFLETIAICDDCYDRFIDGIYPAEVTDEITMDNVDDVILDGDE